MERPTRISANVYTSAAITALILSAGCRTDLGLKRSEDSSTVQAAPVMKSVRVTRENFSRSLLVSGELTAVRSTRITVPALQGYGPFVIKALAAEAASVQPGDLLVQFDNSVLLTLLETEQINRERAANELIRKRAELQVQLNDLEIQAGRTTLELEKAKLKAEIPKELLAVRDWQEYQFARDKADKELEKATQSLELFKKAAAEELKLLELRNAQISSKIAELKAAMNAAEIRATQRGVVVYESLRVSKDSENPIFRKVRVGDLVYYGYNLLYIPDVSEMEVRAYVNEVDGGLIQPGLRARIVPDSRADLEFGGVVDHVPEVAERASNNSSIRVFSSKIKLDNTDPQSMKPGMSVRVEIFLLEEEGLVLPRASVFHEGGKSFVRLRGGEKREIKVRTRNATHCLIDGLPAGMEVAQ